MNNQNENTGTSHIDIVSASEEINLYRIWRILAQSKLLAVSIVALSLSIAILVAVLSPKVYRSTVSLIPASTDTGSQLASLGGLNNLASIAGFDIGGNDPDKAEAIAVLRSRFFTSSFIEAQNLLPDLFSDEWDSENNSWRVSNFDIPTLNDAFELFDEDVRQITEHNSGVTTVTIDWHDPQIAADWANGLVNKLNFDMRERAIAEAERSLAFLRAEQEKTSMVQLEQAIYRMIEIQIHNIMLANVREEFSFRVIDPAVPADIDEYVSPKRLLIMVVGLVIGLIVALVFVLFVDLLQRQKASSNTRPDS